MSQKLRKSRIQNSLRALAAASTAVALLLVADAPARADDISPAVSPAFRGSAAAKGSQPVVRVLLFTARRSVRARWAGADWREFELTAAGESRAEGALLKRWDSPASDSIEIGTFRVRGAVEVLRRPGGLAVVNELPLESYLAGSLGREMHASWKQAALRAQAVASRTYALYRVRAARGAAGYHLTSDTGSQVYRGIEAESPSVWAALAATRGQVLTVAGRPILAAFHSASGGVTASAEEVWGEPHAYLISQPVEGEDDSPDTYWRAAVSRTTLGRAATGLGSPIGDIRKLRIVARGASGRAELLRATGTRGTAEFTGRELRRALGESTLKSTLFDVRRNEDGFVFVGSGRGHGVGMSQWGARALAERGDTYEQILRIFYPGAELGRWGASSSAGVARPLALAERGAQ